MGNIFGIGSGNCKGQLMAAGRARRDHLGGRAALAAGILAFLAPVQSAFAAETAPPGTLAAPVPFTQNTPMMVSSEPQLRGNRIYRSVGKDGTVVYGDQPEPGAKQASAVQYMSYSSPQAMSRAEQERAYWRSQAEQLRQRQAVRDQERENARQRHEQELAVAALMAQERWYPWRPVVGLRNFPPRPITGVAPVFQGSPGLVGSRPQGFLTSGMIIPR